MSEVSLLLGNRIIRPLPAPRTHDASALAEECPGGSLCSLAVGGHAVISGFSTDVPGATQRRLVDLGFLPGASVTLLRRAPLGGPLVFRVGTSEFALRRRDAAAINAQLRTHLAQADAA